MTSFLSLIHRLSAKEPLPQRDRLAPRRERRQKARDTAKASKSAA
ncbi:hypothetical protein [Coleofasciculus sp. FACHB-129]|nr:hypothetical protein [Coleofasciculus sp. FACHB-129]